MVSNLFIRLKRKKGCEDFKQIIIQLTLGEK